MKKNVLVLVVFTIFLAVSPLRAEDGLGVGIIIGEPTGVTLKKWLGKDRAIDAAAGWDFSGHDSFQFHADYLLHNFGLLKTGNLGGRLPLYYGVGGRISFNDHHDGHDHHDTVVGVRVPVGLAYLFPKAPVEMFVELVPILNIVPDTDLDLGAAIGVRYYF